MRKTHTVGELSEARRRASLSRKHFRGGRPRGWAKDPSRPPSTIGVDPLDAEILRRFGRLKGFPLRRVVHTLCAALVLGSEIRPRPELAPEAWTYRGQ